MAVKVGKVRRVYLYDFDGAPVTDGTGLWAYVAFDANVRMGERFSYREEWYQVSDLDSEIGVAERIHRFGG